MKQLGLDDICIWYNLSSKERIYLNSCNMDHNDLIEIFTIYRKTYTITQKQLVEFSY